MAGELRVRQPFLIPRWKKEKEEENNHLQTHRGSGGGEHATSVFLLRFSSPEQTLTISSAVGLYVT